MANKASTSEDSASYPPSLSDSSSRHLSWDPALSASLNTSNVFPMSQTHYSSINPSQVSYSQYQDLQHHAAELERKNMLLQERHNTL